MKGIPSMPCPKIISETKVGEMVIAYPVVIIISRFSSFERQPVHGQGYQRRGNGESYSVRNDVLFSQVSLKQDSRFLTPVSAVTRTQLLALPSPTFSFLLFRKTFVPHGKKNDHVLHLRCNNQLSRVGKAFCRFVCQYSGLAVRKSIICRFFYFVCLVYPKLRLDRRYDDMSLGPSNSSQFLQRRIWRPRWLERLLNGSFASICNTSEWLI